MTAPRPARRPRRPLRSAAGHLVTAAGAAANAAGRLPAIARFWDRFTRWIKAVMPKGLYARALLIIIAPMVMLQSVVAFVFMERHWNLVTRHLSAAVARDIAALIEIYKTYPQDADRAQLRRIAQDRLGLVGRFPARDGNAAAGTEAVLLAARPGAVGGAPQADRAAVLDRHRRPLRRSSRSASSSTTR